jgi:hypothetical protein
MDFASDSMHAFSSPKVVDDLCAVRTIVNAQVALGDPVAIDTALKWASAL